MDSEVFVGAGAPRDAPASLPDFRQLTSSIAVEANNDFAPTELESLDVLQGRRGDVATRCRRVLCPGLRQVAPLDVGFFQHGAHKCLDCPGSTQRNSTI
jgi:hypothetical protein